MTDFEMFYIDVWTLVEKEIGDRKKNLFLWFNILKPPAYMMLFTLWLGGVYITFPYITRILELAPEQFQPFLLPIISISIASFISTILPAALPILLAGPLRYLIKQRPIVGVTVNVLFVFPLNLLLLDFYLLPLLIGNETSIVGNALSLYAITWAVFLFLLGCGYLVSSVLTAADDFFWILPTVPQFDPDNVNRTVIIDSYRTTWGYPRLPFLETQTAINEFKNTIRLNQGYSDSQAQSLGGIVGTLGLVGLVLSVLDNTRRASIFDAAESVFVSQRIASPESSASLSNFLEVALLTVIGATVFVLLRGLANVYKKIHVLELMDAICNECAKQLPDDTPKDELDSNRDWWHGLKSMFQRR